MSELDKWEKDSKRATTLLVSAAMCALGAVIKHIVNSTSDASYTAAKKAISEDNLTRENNRSWISKQFHTEDRKKAQSEYEKYH